MARVTVEDCVSAIPNRFELVILASERAKNIASGAVLTIDRDNDKNPVVALREIATKSIDPNALREMQILCMRKKNQIDSIPEENFPYLENNEVSTDTAEIDYSGSNIGISPQEKDNSNDNSGLDHVEVFSSEDDSSFT